MSCLNFRITITVILVIVVVQAVRSTQEKRRLRMAHKKNHKLTEAEIEALLQEDDFSDITLDDELEEEQETSFDRET